MPSKYIVLQTPEGERAFLCPSEDFYHDDLARCYEDYEVIAAGFMSVDNNGKIKCFGKSEGLNIRSRGIDDAALIRQQMKP